MRSSTCHLVPLVSPLHLESCGFGSQCKLQIADGPYKLPLDFDLPDYKAVGATLLDLTRSYHFDDTSPPEMDDDLGFTSPLNWDMLALPKLVSQAQFHSTHSVFPHTLVYHLLDDDSLFREPKQETKWAPPKHPAAGLPKTIPHPRTVPSVASTTTTTTTLKSRTSNSRPSRPDSSVSSAVPTTAPDPDPHSDPLGSHAALHPPLHPPAPGTWLGLEKLLVL